MSVGCESRHYDFILKSAIHSILIIKPSSLGDIVHTLPAVAAIRHGGIRRVKTDQLMIEPDKKYFINTGSVGQPRDGDWRAAYCIYNPESNCVEQRRTKYDLDTAQQKIIKAGLPRLLGERLKLGR